MKTLNSLMALTLLSTIAVSCGPKVIEKQIVTEKVGSSPQGGETHGGDVLRARARNYRDTILEGNLALEVPFPGPYKGQYTWIKTREVVKSFMTGLSVIAQRTSKQEVRDLLKGLVDRESEILRDIETSKYDVKIFPPAETPDVGGPEYDVCRDYHGNLATAGAKLNDMGGTICIDAKKLAVENPSGTELAALIVHEHLHHLGFEEEKSVEIQRLLVAKGPMMQRFAADYQTDDPFFFFDLESNNLPAAVRMTAIEGLRFKPDSEGLNGQSFRSLYAVDLYCGIFMGECFPLPATSVEDTSVLGDQIREFKFNENVKVFPGAVINLPVWSDFMENNDPGNDHRIGTLLIEFLDSNGKVIGSLKAKIGIQKDRKAGILFY